MSKRPENVKCENCVYAEVLRRAANADGDGALRCCFRPKADRPYPPHVYPDEFCSEFRSSWPEESR